VSDRLEYDPNTSTSNALVEIRTVLSRARTAIETIDNAGAEFVVVPGRWTKGEHVPAETIPHPEREEMLAALRAFVAEAARWEKRGSRRRGPR
jgi:hypothetical protein